jgi:hypothetical protein
VPGAVGRVEVADGCALELHGYTVDRADVSAGGTLTLVGGTLGRGTAQRAADGPWVRLVLTGLTAERVDLAGGELELSDVTIGRIDADEGARIVGRDVRMSELRIRGGVQATITRGRVDGYLSVNAATLKAEALELATRMHTSGRAVIALTSSTLRQNSSRRGQYPRSPQGLSGPVK